MTREELITQLQGIVALGPGAGVEMYFLVEENGAQLIREVDIDDDAAEQIRLVLTGQIASKFINNPELRLAKLSDADDRKNTVYEYDHAELPWDLEALRTIKANRAHPEFSFADHPMESVLAMVFVLGANGNEVVIYKKRYTVSVIQRGTSFLGFFEEDKRFVPFEKDIIRVNDKFEFILVKNEVIVCSVPTLEKFYGFDAIVTREATNRMSLIREANLIEGLEDLERLVTERLPAAKKLVKAKKAAIILKKPAKKIFTFAQKNPRLKGKFKLSEDGTRLVLSTIEARQLFLRLLDDDFLRSQLTGLAYETSNKDEQKEDETSKDNGADTAP